MLNRIAVRALVVLIAGAFLVTAAVQAQTTWYVDDDAPGDPGPGDPSISDPLEDGSAEHPFDAIQEAIDAAADGDTVLVAGGTYTGAGNKNLDYAGRAITVCSESGPEDCVIDCQDSGRGFYFDGGATPEAVVDGFTIINGNVTLGGGVYCANDCSPTIRNCIISGHAGYVGGGVYCHGNCHPTISNCLISDNAVTGGGGGICCRSSSNPTIVNCTITENTADGHGGAIYCVDNSYPTVANCTISENAAQNAGGAIYCGHSDMTLSNCLIVANAARSFWYGNIQVASGSSVTIANCTLLRNTGWNAPSIAVHCTNSSVTITNSIMWESFQAHFGLFGNSSLAVSYSDIQGGAETVWCLDPNACTVDWGPGNIDADPRFVHADLHLRADSPCVDAGDPDGDYTGQSDMDGEVRVAHGRADIGADEFLDTDADDLPDRWEQLHFGSPTAGDPAADDDNDGLVNVGEYALHRNPFQPPTTYYVDVAGDDAWDGLAPKWDGQHGPKATIQAALDTADYYEQDLVLVADGTYTGHVRWGLNFRGRTLTLRSMNGPDNCIIDCEHDRRGFRFINQETPLSVVAGFSVINGYGGHGGGIFCRTFTSPTFANCRFVGCESKMFGGAVCVMEGCNLTLANCLLAGNRAPDPIFGIGGGVSCYESGARIINCTIVGNVAGFRGGAVDLYGCSTPRISNSILWGNSAVQKPGVGTFGYGVWESPVSPCYPHLTASYSDIQDADPNRLVGWGPGNFNADPLFVDADGPDDDPNTWEDNDHRLSPGSPGIDVGDAAAVPADSADLDDDGDTGEPIPFDLDYCPRLADDPGMPDGGCGSPPIIDAGTYEFRGETCFGDLDGDQVVGSGDLLRLLLSYGTTRAAAYTDGDLDRDGDVDLADLAALLTVYGMSCE